MEHKRCLVTLTDNIGPTSMPFNEFLLYRLQHYPEEKQIIILLFKSSLTEGVTIPENVDCYIVGKSLFKLRNVIAKIRGDYNDICYHIHEGKSVLFFSLSTLLKYRYRTVYTLHSTYRNYPFHNKLFSFCASLLSKDVVCVSKTSFKYYPNILKRFKGHRATYIQNGVDTERIENVKANVINDNRPFTMIYVARLVALKRHYILLEALKRLPCVRLLLIGIGPLESDLKNRVKELGLENQVLFLGLKTREEVYRTLKESDLYVSSSSYEGLPVGVLEAMACGTPCLVSDIEQHAEIAEKCPTLQLCPDDINQWVQRIQCQMKLSKSDIEIIKMRNKQSVLKNFSLESMHKHYNELYFNT